MVKSTEESYSYLKLLRAQYSWNNDKVTFYINSVLSLAISLLYVLTGVVTYTETSNPVEVFSSATFLLWMVWFGWLMVLYHTIKFIVLGVVLCGAITYFAKYGDEKEKSEAQERYREMMSWRQ